MRYCAQPIGTTHLAHDGPMSNPNVGGCLGLPSPDDCQNLVRASRRLLLLSRGGGEGVDSSQRAGSPVQHVRYVGTRALTRGSGARRGARRARRAALARYPRTHAMHAFTQRVH